MTTQHEGQLERTVNSTLATNENAIPTPTFNFDSSTGYHQIFSGYQLDGRGINAHLSITRKQGKFKFSLFLRYDDGKPVLVKNDREYNFAKRTGFTVDKLFDYIKQEGLQVTLPTDIYALEAERQRLYAQKDVIWKDPSIPNKYAESMPIKERIKDLDRAIAEGKSQSVQPALEHAGEQWIGHIVSNLRDFIEKDSTAASGMRLRNLIRYEQTPGNYPTQSFPWFLIAPGSFGSGRGSR